MLSVVRRDCGLSSELLYADDLVLMAPTMDQLGSRVAEWGAILLDKGLKVSAGKSKVMFGSSGGKMLVNSGKWPCGVCRKGVQEKSGDLSRVADGFRCSDVTDNPGS